MNIHIYIYIYSDPLHVHLCAGVKTVVDVLEIEDEDAQELGLKLVDRKKLAKFRAEIQRLEAGGMLGGMEVGGGGAGGGRVAGAREMLGKQLVVDEEVEREREQEREVVREREMEERRMLEEQERNARELAAKALSARYVEYQRFWCIVAIACMYSDTLKFYIVAVKVQSARYVGCQNLWCMVALDRIYKFGHPSYNTLWL